VERFVQAVRQECLNKFIVFGKDHMDHVVREYVDHRERPHQGKGNVPLNAAGDESRRKVGEAACRERLAGVLRHYYRQAG
jgi:putative transposase